MGRLNAATIALTMARMSNLPLAPIALSFYEGRARSVMSSPPSVGQACDDRREVCAWRRLEGCFASVMETSHSSQTTYMRLS